MNWLSADVLETSAPRGRSPTSIVAHVTSLTRRWPVVGSGIQLRDSLTCGELDMHMLAAGVGGLSRITFKVAI